MKYQHNKYIPMEMVSVKSSDKNEDVEAFYSHDMIRHLIDDNIIDLNFLEC